VKADGHTVSSPNEVFMNYLGEEIEVVEAELGWVGIWHHHLVMHIEVGYFTTPKEALELMMELIRRDFAATALLEVVDEWREAGLIGRYEQEKVAESLVESVLAILENTV
jgi:hypothetical protein